MKKRLYIVLLFALFVLPVCIKADTYVEATNKVNSLLDKNEFKNSYNKYLFTTNTNRYSQLLSKEEFEMTRYDKNKNYRSFSFSYLWDSRPFWSNVENVPIRDGYAPLDASENTDNIGTKVTQLVKNDVSVYGTGTYSDPWLFAPQYKVLIRVNNYDKGHITDSSYSDDKDVDEIEFIYTAGSGVKYIYIKSFGANQYIGSSCGNVINSINANNKYEKKENGNVVVKGGYLLISDITRDTECMINFGEQPRKVILDQSYNDIAKSSPKELYLATETGWYLDQFGNNQVNSISEPKRLGYLYKGYNLSSNKDNACSGTPVIFENLKLENNRNVLKNIQNNDTLYVCYEPIKYTIEYICQDANGETTTSDHIYNVAKNLKANSCTKVGYDFKNWSTNPDGTGSTYNNNVSVTGIYSVHNGVLKLYSQWKPKTNISYVVNHWQQTSTGGNEFNNTNFAIKESSNKSDGTADATVSFSPKTYTGFVTPASQNVKIKPDGSTVVNFYYIRNVYTVSYNCNNGSGSTASSTHRYDVDKALTSNGCTRVGYNFDGWATSSTGNVAYGDSATVKNLSLVNGATVTLYAHWSKCTAGTYGSNGTSCSSCPTGYTSDVGADSINDCYLTTTAGKYVATANQNQTTCAANGYCVGGTKVYYGNTGGRSACPANYGTSPAGSDANTDCYLTTTAGNYVATATQNQTTCTANYYCAGGTKVYYNSTGGRSACPANYGTAPAGSDAAADCYLTTTAGNYVASAKQNQTQCAANGYCAGGTKIYYGNTGGRSSCPENYGTSVAGSDAIGDCYLTTTAGKYVASANSAQTTCTANYYCPSGTTIYYGDTGGRTACPANYGTSATGSDAAGDCYLTTTAGSYVATAKAAQVTCTANYYCVGGTTIYYGKTGGRSACSTGYHSSAGATSCTANTYYVSYKANGGSGTMNDSTHTYDVAKTLTANAFSRSGYTFNGWNTKSDGSGTAYSNKKSVSNLTSTNGGTVNLYAQWQIAVSCDAAAITYYNQNEQRSPIPCNVYNGVYKCSANTSTGKCDCDIKAFYSGSKYYCCNFDKRSFSPSYTDDSGYRWCERSYTPVSKGSTCQVVNNSYNWCDKYW